MKVTVSTPYWRVGADVRRAVDSILAQTYGDLRIVVVNDGDPDPPWRWLDDIADPRLVRFDLPENRGRYFCDAVIFSACEPELWAVQDADDWSEPERFEVMVPLADEYGAGFGPAWRWQNGSKRLAFRGVNDPARPDRIGKVGRGYLAGAISGDRVRQAGGFHPGFRVGFDTYLMNVVKLTGGWGSTTKPLYNRVVRADSLTRAKDTRGGSPQRRAAQQKTRAMYQRASRLYRTGRDPGRAVRDTIPADLRAEVEREADRLRRLL